MPVLRNARHEKFCQELAQGKSAAEAYVSAGFRPSRQNAGRLRTRDDINERTLELQCNAARSCEVSIQSILNELNEAIAVARERGQAQAMVSASSMKAKLTGLMIDKQELRVSEGEFDESMSVEEILQKVSREAGLDAAIALCRAFQMDPVDFDLSGKHVAEPVPAVTVPKPARPSVIEWRPPRPDPKREL